MRDLPDSLELLSSPDWTDYELLDSGAGQKLERFGEFRCVRPEQQATWHRTLPDREWQQVQGVFESGAESGRWKFSGKPPQRWQMQYRSLKFLAEPTPFRHMGVFPEQACHWDWAADLIRSAGRPIRVLSLFGYTGLFALSAAAAGADVTHVDASKTVNVWAQENQILSGLDNAPVRWITDDALKFVRREARRGSHYDAIMIDPPKFGRGPKGQVWKIEVDLPPLLEDCRAIMTRRPLFVILGCYAIRASALSLYYPLRQLVGNFGGQMSAGEVTVSETRGTRSLSLALFARWKADS
ncbi:MAG: class I SAM-dependent methyltransferase [Planctomycetaceae bacterium]